MACLFKRENGFYYIVSLRGRRRKWESLRTRSEEQARKVFDERMEEEEARRVMRFSFFSKEFLERGQMQYKGNTLVIYRAAFRNFERLVGDKALRRIGPMDVERFKAARLKEVSASSVNVEFRSLRAAFGDARRLKLIDENPFGFVKSVAEPFHEAAYLPPAEIRRLLATIDDPAFREIVIFALLTMMRRGEIVNLTWDDVDLTSEVIKVRPSRRFRPKAGKSRLVPMHPWVHELLTRLPRRGGLVFCRPGGFAITGDWLSRRLKYYLKRGGFDERLHFHSLRHSGISWLHENRVPTEHIQRIAGHSNALTTQVYLHADPALLLKAVGAFGDFSQY
jgi:integrase/recombinase XerD